jgi:ATP-dependent DNA helicase RecQ
VADVLVGSATERVVQRGHDKLSTFNLLAGQPKAVVTEWINQLLDQGLLLREGEYRTLALSEAGWEVLRSEAEAQLFAVEDSRAGNGGARQRLRRRPPPAPRTPSPIEPPRPLNFDEQSVFDRLKAVRRQLAEELNTAAFMVFSDKTLRELARARPTSREAMLAVKGVGPRKVEAFGELFLAAIQSQE